MLRQVKDSVICLTCCVDDVVEEMRQVLESRRVVLADLAVLKATQVARVEDRVDHAEHLFEGDCRLDQGLVLGARNVLSKVDGFLYHRFDAILTDEHVWRILAESCVDETKTEAIGTAEESADDWTRMGELCLSLGEQAFVADSTVKCFLGGEHPLGEAEKRVAVIGEEEVIVELVEIIEGVVLDGFENEEEVGEATVPVVGLTPVLGLVSLFNLLVERVQSDDVAEQVLEPGCEDIAPAIELLALNQAVVVDFEA